MRLQLSVLAICGLLAAVALAREEKAKSDKDAIQGTWVPVSGTEDGKPTPEDMIKGRKMIFSADKATMIMGNDKHEMSYEIDSSASPKHIDVKFPDGKTGKGIYEIKGDTLKIAHGKMPGSPRPKDFTSKEGSGVAVMEFKREKKQ